MKRLFIITLLLSFGFSQKDFGSFRVTQSTFLRESPKPLSSNLTRVMKDSFILVKDTLVNDWVFAGYMGMEGWILVDKTTLDSKSIEDLKRKQRIKTYRNEVYESDLKTDLTPPPLAVKKENPKLKNEVKKTQNTNNQPIALVEKNQSEPPYALYFWIVLLAIGLVYLFIKFFKIKNKYSDIIDIDSEVEKSKLKNELLKQDYSDKKSIYKKLIEEINKITEDLELKDVGHYEPQFDYDTPEKYKQKIKSIIGEQKGMIRNKTAINVYSNWTINESKGEGTKMTNRMVRIALKAFNGESNSIIAKVTWRNLDTSENRLERSREQIDRLLETVSMQISNRYYSLKEKELFLTHEYKEQLQRVKELRKAKSDAEKEERRVIREAQKAQKEAEKEQKLAEDALLKAKEELSGTTGKELDEKNELIANLEKQLKEAIAKGERAKSRAQFTKEGHVYVISNLGSFGEGIYKIGLTRRLEPLDRVKELGDASVPFLFDMHAMIFSEDAPALEKKLHDIFHDKRVNLVNNRKEFFKVTLDEIKNEVMKIEPKAKFIDTAESKEFRETQSILNAKSGEVKKSNKIEDKFPEEL